MLLVKQKLYFPKKMAGVMCRYITSRVQKKKRASSNTLAITLERLVQCKNMQLLF